MSQKIEDIHTGLIAALTGDAGLTGWAETHFGVGTTLTAIKANASMDKINVSDLPGIIMEIGDTEAEGLPGNSLHEVTHDIDFAFVWVEQDAATAWTQRLQLHDLVIKALMANASLGVPGAGAWVSRVESDQNVFHPKHVMRFTATTEFHVESA